jgi:hypothetical protein
MRNSIVAAFFCCLIAGCAHIQLKNNALGQYRTVGDLYQQQVLDNLAMFVYDRGSLPYFSVLSTATDTVSDMASASDLFSMGRVGVRNLFMVTGNAATLGASRGAMDGWTANSVNDPRRLELMRCAYQLEVSGPDAIPDNCPNCKHRFAEFYTGDPLSKDEDIKAQARITNFCLGTHAPWFGCGKKCDVPKFCNCLLVGHYCGVYVWVLPDHRDELAKLTLAILDYATNQPAILTKEITYNIDENGNALKGDKKSIGSVKVTVPYSVSNVAVLEHVHTLEKLKALNVVNPHTLGAPTPSQLPRPPMFYQNTQPPDFQFLNQRLQFAAWSLCLTRRKLAFRSVNQRATLPQSFWIARPEAGSGHAPSEIREITPAAASAESAAAAPRSPTPPNPGRLGSPAGPRARTSTKLRTSRRASPTPPSPWLANARLILGTGWP